MANKKKQKNLSARSKPKLAILKSKKNKKIAKSLRKSKKKWKFKKTARNSKQFKNKKIVKIAQKDFFKAKIKVIGIGGGGGSIVSDIGRSLEKATFVIADTDIRSIKKRAGVKYFLFGEEKTHGLGTGGNPEFARKATEESKEKIEKLFFDQDIVILISSLGGGLGSGATEIFAKLAMASGAITMGIFTLPFKFEGKNKSRIALKYLKDLRNCLNVSITIPNEKIFKVIDINTPITEAFSVVNKNLIESLESLIDLIYNPGLINIDFADLRTILKGKGSMAFLNTAEESGKDRAEKICQKILINPLYQTNNFSVEKILFNVSGPSDLKMQEVEKISKTISDLNPKSKVIFGISRGKSKSKIKTTILMTGTGNETKKNIAATPEIIKKETEVFPAPVEQKKNKKAEPQKIKKQNDKKIKKQNDKKIKETLDVPPVKLVPVFEKEAIGVNQSASTSIDEKPENLILPEKSAKKIIRRSALEIRKAEEIEENKKMAQEEEWEIPAFLRRVKFKS